MNRVPGFRVQGETGIIDWINWFDLWDNLKSLESMQIMLHYYCSRYIRAVSARPPQCMRVRRNISHLLFYFPKYTSLVWLYLLRFSVDILFSALPHRVYNSREPSLSVCRLDHISYWRITQLQPCVVQLHSVRSTGLHGGVGDVLPSRLVVPLYPINSFLYSELDSWNPGMASHLCAHEVDKGMRFGV